MKRFVFVLVLYVLCITCQIEAATPDYAKMWQELSAKQRVGYFYAVMDGMRTMCNLQYMKHQNALESCNAMVDQLDSISAYNEFEELFKLAYIDGAFPNCPFLLWVGEWAEAKLKHKELTPSWMTELDNLCKQRNNRNDLLEEFRK